MTRLLPHPGLSVLLVAMWMVMVNDLTFGTLFLGLVVGIAVPLFTAPWWPVGKMCDRQVRSRIFAIACSRSGNFNGSKSAQGAIT